LVPATHFVHVAAPEHSSQSVMLSPQALQVRPVVSEPTVW
jgi:hypothetical protein